MGSAHPAWYERATPDEIDEIDELDRPIADYHTEPSHGLPKVNLWEDWRLSLTAKPLI
jgi:hypothetical protein